MVHPYAVAKHREHIEPKYPNEPIEEAEIHAALQTSGFPLEMRLMKFLHDRRMQPEIGLRVQIDDEGTTREVDLLAKAFVARRYKVTSSAETPTSRILSVLLQMVIEAKSLEPGAAFVGFHWRGSPPENLRTSRTRFGGTPALDEMDEKGPFKFLFEPGGVATALDGLNHTPVCIQWAVIRRTKPGSEQKSYADHDESFWKGMDTIVRASRTIRSIHTHSKLEENHSLLAFANPTMVIGTPHLFLYDVIGRTLARTPRLIVKRAFDVGDISDEYVVDVVTEDGMGELVDAYQETAKDVLRAAAKHRDQIHELGRQQREQRLIDEDWAEAYGLT